MIFRYPIKTLISSWALAVFFSGSIFFSNLAVAGEEGEYQLQPEDVLQITVYEEPELSTQARISAQGEINFPLLGLVKAGGQTVPELQENLRSMLEADYLVNPQVQVFIQSYHNRTFSVTGSVNKPGSYQLQAGKVTTVMDAIALAGGFKKEAALTKLRVIRSQDGQPTTISVNAKEIVKKGDKNKDIEIRPNDVIFVPESWI